MDLMDGLTLRSASPTLDDAHAFAHLLDEAHEGWYRAALGNRFGDYVAEAYRQPRNELSYENVTFAVRGDQVVGMGAGYSAASKRSFTEVLPVVTTGWRRQRLRAVSRFSRRMLSFIDVVPEGDFYVRALAVDGGYRGGGIGTILLESLEDRARDAGSSRLALDVAAKNKRARQLYERVGMSAEAESRRWFGLPNTNVIRMVIRLSPQPDPA
jgi:ribosomal protein S18 acetylase RimI-like enzyme